MELADCVANRFCLSVNRSLCVKFKQLNCQLTVIKFNLFLKF